MLIDVQGMVATVSVMEQIAELMRIYQLTEREVGQEISETHITQITLLSWEEVGQHLPGVSRQDIRDIDKDGHEQMDKRRRLLDMWKERNGSNATYIAMITAMLKAQKREEAEAICRLLRPNCKGIIRVSH